MQDSYPRRSRALVRAGVFTAAALLTANTLHADDRALLDLLEKKGIVSKTEAANLRKELASDKQNPAPADSASKVKLSSAVTELKLYGDLRLRYQYDTRDSQLDPVGTGTDEDRSPSGSQQSRWRFRLRLGAEIQLGEHWFGGVELSTAQASDTGNQTFENGFDDYNIYISKAFLGWRPNEVLTLTAGKFTNPFYTTELVWDSDITPTGVAEVVNFHKLFGGTSDAGFSKDGKSLAAPTPSPWTLSLVAGQFLFDDNLENSFDNDSSDDAYLFQTQLIASYQFSKNVKATIAPGWLVETAGSVSGLQNAEPFNDSPTVSGATRNISLLLLPGDVAFKLGNTKAKLIWDLAYNVHGGKRYRDIYGLTGNHGTLDDLAFLAGVQIGENKKSGDWSLLSYYRQAGVSSIDPNLNDSDFAASRLNTAGIKAGIAYSFTDFAIGAVTYQYAWDLRNNLTGGQATGGSAIADTNDISIFQVDLTVKF